MLSFEEARKTVLDSTWRLAPHRLKLDQALGHILAAPIEAQVDQPLFDNSAVDGFAIRSKEIKSSVSLTLQSTIAAGASSVEALRPTLAARIFTGAPVPKGADAVVMQEDCEWDEHSVTVNAKPEPGQHVRFRGEEFKKGQELLPAGVRVTPPVIGLLASNGLENCEVFARPKTRIVCTGSEIVELGTPLRHGQIYNSNGPSIASAVNGLGLSANYQAVADDQEAIQSLIGQMWQDTDVLIVCGGVSVGDHDLVKGAMKHFEVEERFWRVSMRPGKPLYFGIKGRTLVFGLPGNPVSALICFHLFVRPALLKMTGFPEEALVAEEAVLANSLENADMRAEFVRGIRQGDGSVRALEGRGSHMLSGLAMADCLICLMPQARLDAGESVNIYRIGWFL